MISLEVKNIHAAHGQLNAVNGVSLTLNKGEMLFLLGSNGAGKTTLLRSIVGDHRAKSGEVSLLGKNISNLSAFERAREGLALVPEGRRLFPHMSVRENLILGTSTHRQGDWSVDRIYEAFPNLKKLDKSLAGKLSGGEQQAIAIGRALMGNPHAIILDEVSLGLSPAAVDLAYETLEKLREMGMALLIVEQDLSRALNTADELMVMCEGDVTLHTKPSDTSLEHLIEASFGHKEGELE